MNNTETTPNVIIKQGKTDIELSCKVKPELIKQLTKQCKDLGYKRKVLLGFIFDNEYIFKDICREISEDFYTIQREVSCNIREYKLSETGVTIYSEGTFKSFAKYNYGITKTMFLHYIATRDVLKDYELYYPKELKMKKALKGEKKKAIS